MTVYLAIHQCIKCPHSGPFMDHRSIGIKCLRADRHFPRDFGSAVYPKEIPDWCPLQDENKPEEIEENNMSDKYQKHSPTSREAAFFSEGFSGVAREQVFLQIVKRGGATDEEVQETIKMNPSTERPRRVELVEMGIIKDSGHTRPTSSGMDAVIWTATGRKYIASEFLSTRPKKSELKIKREEKALIRVAREYAAHPTSEAARKLLILAKELK